MRSFRVVPWGHPDELPHVARLFFRRGEVNGDRAQLRQACDIVEAWKYRGGVPHAITATFGLVEAILHDGDDGPDAETRGASAFARTVVYAGTISDLVTGYLDTMQTGKAKRSMYDLATEIEMPRAFVEVRHLVAHEGNGAVTLAEHRRVNREALRWVYGVYWRDVLREDDDRGPKPLEREDEFRDYVKLVLEEYEAKKEAEWNREILDFDQGRPGTRPPPSAASAAVDLLLKDGKSTAHLALIANVLLTKDHLLKIPCPMCAVEDKACRFWDPLLLELALAAPYFTVIFVRSATTLLCEPTPGISGVETAVVAWILHAFRDHTWSRLRYMSRHEELSGWVIERCDESPGMHTTLLMDLLSKP